MQRRLIYNYLTDDELLRISNTIREVERKTSGEVAVSIKEKRKFFSRNKSIEKLAEEEFNRVGVGKTKDRTGILFFLLLSEKKFMILADKGINDVTPKETWIKLKEELEVYFKKGEFSKGLIYGIRRAGEILALHLPVQPGDMNEISDKVIIR
jgi:uncharacterized membrane protein